MLALGVLLLSLRGGRDLAKLDRVAVGFALFTAVTVCAYSVVDGVGARLAGSANAYSAALFVGIGPVMALYAVVRSGRGVGTGVGTMLVIEPVAVLLATPVFIGVILLTRYVSLGSLIGSAAMFPAMLLVLLVIPDTPLPYVIYSAVGAALIWLAHADNIDRLLHGTERKFDLRMLVGKGSSQG
jgi:acyl-phosphate glycerol 3-phosphate acyltransferase